MDGPRVAEQTVRQVAPSPTGREPAADSDPAVAGLAPTIQPVTRVQPTPEETARQAAQRLSAPNRGTDSARAEARHAPAIQSVTRVQPQPKETTRQRAPLDE